MAQDMYFLRLLPVILAQCAAKSKEMMSIFLHRVVIFYRVWYIMERVMHS